MRLESGAGQLLDCPSLYLVGHNELTCQNPGQTLPDGNCEGSDKSSGGVSGPEPSSIALLGLGLIGLVAVRKKA